MNGKLFLIPAIVCPILIGWLVYTSAEKFYNFHRNISEQYPGLFKIIGFNARYMNDKKAWIRHYRMYVVLMVIVIALIAASMIVSLELNA